MNTQVASSPIADQLEEHRRELTGYCYRMLGSAVDAEDAVQETMVRAWRAADRFEGRAALRTWLYRIAANVCFDHLQAGKRRALPLDLSGPTAADRPDLTILPEATWIGPIPEARVLDPASSTIARESIRLAFIAALQHLPSRQRAVLILRDVLRFEATEVAALLDTSVAAVTSALQRARATMTARDLSPEAAPAALDARDRELLDRYLEAFERYDLDALVPLIQRDARQSMPPYAMWLEGRDDILAFWFGPGRECRGSRLVATTANGAPAFAQYRPSGPDGLHRPWSLQVLEVSDGAIAGFTMFLDTSTVFPLFGLPDHPDGALVQGDVTDRRARA
jgi:RNA polymerase sigma-70 factor (ECF subfamily)